MRGIFILNRLSLWITVAIPNDLRPRQAAAINNAGVIEFVGKNGIALLHQGRNYSEVGVQS